MKPFALRLVVGHFLAQEWFDKLTSNGFHVK